MVATRITPSVTEFRLSRILRDHSIVSVLNVPVMIDARTWGVLEVDADKPRAFDEGERARVDAHRRVHSKVSRSGRARSDGERDANSGVFSVGNLECCKPASRPKFFSTRGPASGVQWPAR